MGSLAPLRLSTDCRRYAALHTAGLKVKVANKQFVGLEHSGESPQHVYVLNGSLWLCKLGPETVDLELLRAASTPACDVALPGVQQASGALEEFEVTQQGCGQWMPQEFRMCAPHLKGRKQVRAPAAWLGSSQAHAYSACRMW